MSITAKALRESYHPFTETQISKLVRKQPTTDAEAIRIDGIGRHAMTALVRLGLVAQTRNIPGIGMAP
jgi:hypothetical protein